jgi:hypothetical protein
MEVTDSQWHLLIDCDQADVVSARELALGKLNEKADEAWRRNNDAGETLYKYRDLLADGGAAAAWVGLLHTWQVDEFDMRKLDSRGFNMVADALKTLAEGAMEMMGVRSKAIQKLKREEMSAVWKCNRRVRHGQVKESERKVKVRNRAINMELVNRVKGVGRTKVSEGSVRAMDNWLRGSGASKGSGIPVTGVG